MWGRRPTGTWRGGAGCATSPAATPTGGAPPGRRDGRALRAPRPPRSRRQRRRARGRHRTGPGPAWHTATTAYLGRREAPSSVTIRWTSRRCPHTTTRSAPTAPRVRSAGIERTVWRAISAAATRTEAVATGLHGVASSGIRRSGRAAASPRPATATRRAWSGQSEADVTSYDAAGPEGCEPHRDQAERGEPLCRGKGQERDQRRRGGVGDGHQPDGLPPTRACGAGQRTKPTDRADPVAAAPRRHARVAGPWSRYDPWGGRAPTCISPTLPRAETP